MKIQNKIFIKFSAILSFLVFTPFIASAQTGLGGVLVTINNLLAQVVPVLVGIGVVYFIWGVIQYVIADSEEAKSKGRDRIIFGIIGLAVVVSLWGLVNLLADTFVGEGSSITPPGVNNLVTQAPTTGGGCKIGDKLQGLMNYVTCIIGSSVIPLIFAIAMVMFVWGAVNFFIINGGEEEKRTQGKQFMLWGIVALAVMISVWGLVKLFGETFGFRTDVLPGIAPSSSSSSSSSGSSYTPWGSNCSDTNPDNPC
jgi:hypothetical protein